MFGEAIGKSKEELIKEARVGRMKQRLKEVAPPILFTGIVLVFAVLASLGEPSEELVEEEDEAYIPADPEMLRKVREEGATYVYWIDENDVAHHSVILDDGTNA